MDNKFKDRDISFETLEKAVNSPNTKISSGN